jgi:lincosamide nucleotidyltransferase A/C/D/E
MSGIFREVEASDVLEILAALDEQDINYWLDGGWGIDCLLGAQTRSHDDLDLVVLRLELPRVRSLLESSDYQVIRDWLPMSIAFRDDSGREVDLHPIDSTADGGGDQLLTDGETWHYAPPVDGSILGRSVRCSSAEDQMLMHRGYEPRAVDRADVRRIAERFGLPVPHKFRLPTEQPATHSGTEQRSRPL